MFVFKIGHKLTSNDTRTVGHVVWARTHPPPPPPPKKKKNIDQVSVSLRLLVTSCLGKTEFEWRCRSHCLPVAQRVVRSRKPNSGIPALPHRSMRLHCHSFLFNTKTRIVRYLSMICPVKNRCVNLVMTEALIRQDLLLRLFQSSWVVEP